MDWLSISEFFGRYIFPPIVIIILARSGMMKVRYSLTAWVVIVGWDYLTTLIPSPPYLWPPTLQLVISFLCWVVFAVLLFATLLFIYWRSERRKWKEMFPGAQAGKDIWPYLKREPPRHFCPFVSALING